MWFKSDVYSISTFFKKLREFLFKFKLFILFIAKSKVYPGFLKYLKSECQSLLDFAKEYNMEDQISKKTMAIVKEHLTSKKREEEEPVI